MSPATTISALVRSRIAAPIIITLACLAAYANQFTAPFLFDDIPTIVWNENVHGLGAFLRSLGDETIRHDITTAGRPVAAFTFALNHAISGLEPWSYHAVNVAIHIAAALTLLGIVRRTLLLPQFNGRFDRAATGMALIVALLWALHPLQTKAVTYIVQRVESLAGLCLLLTLYLAIRGWTSKSGGAWLIAAIGCCLAGMGVKEVMVVAPVLVLLYDRTFIAGSFAAALRARPRLYAALAATWLGLAVLLAMSPRVALAGRAAELVAPLDYALTQSWAVVHYLRLAVWPHPLVFDYGLPGAGVEVIGRPAQALPWILIIAALVVATLVVLIRRSWIGFLGAWFFIILAPTSSVLPIPMDMIAEHRMYLPLAAVVTLLVVGGFVLIHRTGATAAIRTPVAMAAAAIIIVALGWRTVQRNADFRSDVALWTDTAHKRPNNARAHANLGLALEAAGDVDQAMEHQRLAIWAKPDYPDARVYLGRMLMQRQRPDEAAELFRQALEFKPNLFEARANLGEIAFQQQRLDEAAMHFEQARKLRHDVPLVPLRLGSIRLIQGAADQATSLLAEAVRLDPLNASARHQLGLALAMQGRLAEGRQELERALEIDPSLSAARDHLEQLKSLLQGGGP